MLSISKNKCVGCGLCESECPADSITVNESGVAEIDLTNCRSCRICENVCPQFAIKDITQEYIFAIGTDDGDKIKTDDHFGMSKTFQVWKYLEGDLVYIEKRTNPKFDEDETKTHGDPEKAKAVSGVLGNIDVIIGKRFGPNIKRLKEKFVCAVTRCETVRNSIDLIKENINEIAEEHESTEKKGIVLNAF